MVACHTFVGVGAFLVGGPANAPTRVRPARLQRGVPSVLLRPSAASNDGVEMVADVRKMRAAALKEELKARGVPIAGIVDKEELVALLVRSRQQQPQVQPPPPPSSSSGGGGKKGYAAASVPFRQRTPPSTLPGGGSAAQGPKSYICVDVTVGGQKLEFLVDSGGALID